jgi:hypothetical protein
MLVGVGLAASGRADDLAKLVKKAVERSTLNQPGTKPFHLKATLALSPSPYKDPNMTGEIEYWWVSPSQFKREVRAPGFHQIAIIKDGQEWQENEGDYFPEWLRETAVALIEPVPNLDEVLKQSGGGEARSLFSSIHVSWTQSSTDGTVEKTMGCGISVDGRTGLLSFGSCLSWSAGLKDFKGFHGREVARTVQVGSPEVTATVTTLEDLGNLNLPSDFFATSAAGGDLHPLHTIVIGELALRRNLQNNEPFQWPPVKDGPLQGILTTEVVVDRAGSVRAVGSILSDNPALSEFASKSIWDMKFAPYLVDGEPVQVVSRITMPFKTVRPAGVDTFDSAHNYFERGRHVSFPAAVNGQAYILHATFQVKVAAGTIENGQYVDTWKSDDEWRREGTIGKSRFIRARHGEKRYLLSEGPDDGVLRVVLKAMEPIPAIDTLVESDWRMKWDTVDGVKTIRVLAGYESPDGTLDPEQARGYWFDESGKLIKTYFRGIETRRINFENFGGVAIAHEIRVLHDNKLGMLIRVTEVSAPAITPENIFDLRGHEWKRAFTDEVR